MRLRKNFSVVFDGIVNGFGYIGTIILVYMMAMIGVAIFSRYVLHFPLGWTNEITEYLLVYVGFLGAAWVLKDEGHIKMDLLLNAVSPRTQCMMNIVTSVISTMVALTLTWFSFRVNLKDYQIGYLMPTVLNPPKYILDPGISIGLLLLSLQFIRRTRVFMEKWKTFSKQKSIA